MSTTPARRTLGTGPRTEAPATPSRAPRRLPVEQADPALLVVLEEQPRTARRQLGTGTDPSAPPTRS